MIHWFKIHRDFFLKECYDLSHDSNYQELYQKKSELLVSHGNIIVRSNKVFKHPIIIVYPTATPYTLPLVFPLSKELSESEVEAFADGQRLPFDVIKQFFEYRHQNGSGALCFLEWDGFDSGGQYFGIKSILQRVAKWFLGHINNEFPPDSEEVAFHLHFNRHNKNLYFLYPEYFVTNDMIEGEFYGSQFFDIPKNNIHLLAGLFLGSYISGINQRGIIADPPREIKFTHYIQEQGLSNSLDLETKTDLVKRLINEEKLLKGFWFEIDYEPKPFEKFQELVQIIGKGDIEVGESRLAKTMLDYMKTLPQTINIAIRFPNRKFQKEFQLFTINKIASPTGVILFGDSKEVITSLISNYEIVETVHSEKLSEDTFFQRNSLRADHSILKDKIVNFIGIGALGGEMADSIAKAGVGDVVLWDNQALNVHNIVRHLSGSRFVGIPKAMATRLHLEDHNPFINVQTILENVTNFNIGTIVQEASLTVCSIADDNIEGYINQELVTANKTTFYVRALRGGKVGRIIRVIPNVDACLNCLRLYREEKKVFIEIAVDASLPVTRNECNNPIFPASAADLKLIAAIASRKIIDYLQDGKEDSNQWIWSSEVIPETSIHQPFSIISQKFEPHLECQFCKPMAPVTVTVANSVMKFMVEAVKLKSGIETGGVLAGCYNQNGTIKIKYASDAGPKAVETKGRFVKDIVYCQKFLDDLFAEHGDQAIYLGEWHSHPNENNTPSNLDLESLTAISQQKDYLTDRPLMIIFTKSGVPSCTIHPAGKIYNKTDFQILEV